MVFNDDSGGSPGESLEKLMTAYEDLQSNMETMQNELLITRAVGSSENGLVQATVGPRGQLVDLVIDPMVYRRPDAQELADMVLEATGDAVALVSDLVSEILARHIPPEVRTPTLDQFDFAGFGRRFDTELPGGM